MTKNNEQMTEEDINSLLETAAEGETAETEADANISSKTISDDELLAMCHERVCPNCTEHQEADEARLRALAEMDNVRKRLQREKDEQVKFAAESVLADLLPTLDNLDLALQYGSKDAACAEMAKGIEMTRKLFLDSLAKHGLTRIEESGVEFDPAQHEAVAQKTQDGIPAGQVLQVLQCGYILKSRLLRAAKVMVSA